MKRSGPTKSLREILFSFRKEDWSDLAHFIRSAEWGWALFLLLVVAIAAVLTVRWDPLPSEIQIGSIAPRDIRSDQEHLIIDEEATEALREQARSRILAVYTHDVAYGQTRIETIQKVFSKVRERYAKMLELATAEGVEVLPTQIEELRTYFTDKLNVSLSVRDFQALADHGFNESHEKVLVKGLEEIYAHPLIADPKLLEDHVERGIILQPVGIQAEERELSGKNLARIHYLTDIPNQLENSPLIAAVEETVQPVIRTLTQELLSPTVIFNEEETVKRREKAALTVEKVMIRIQPGESIVRRGDRLQARDISIIEGIRKAKAKVNYRWKLVGTALFVFAALIILYVFSVRYFLGFQPRRRDLIFLGATTLTILGIFRIGMEISSVVLDAVPFDIPSSAIYYLMPVAAIGILVRLVRNSEEALLSVVAMSLLLGLAPDMEISYVGYYLVGGVVAAAASNRADSRSAIGRAGLWTGLAQAFLVIAFELIRSTQITTALEWQALSVAVLCGLLGGLLSAALALVLAPIAESAFGYLTDIKLLELGSLNHPLLRELIVRAPGTYHHSHLVGTLAEAGCQAIGANGLFARVASYFHDIGKMTKSDYFIENQPRGVNRHESLTPSMSALIIQNHVKDGMELAKKHKLPQQIIDIIPQHQGTKLIRFFYGKAKESENPEVSTVNEKDYRYPGPKPQTREAGVILISDSVEAAVRSLGDKTPEKIRKVVEKMINQNFTDGQLDECDMTLQNLHQIADTFTRIMVGIYHQRIEYPELPDKEKGTPAKKTYEEDQYRKPEPIKDRPEKEAANIVKHPTRDRLSK